MNPLEEHIAEQIRTRGPMPFAAFMSLALYHPKHGYYSTEPRAGWTGHFITSAEIDPAFGRLWAGAFEQVWDAAGKPGEFHLIEIGPGEGAFAGAVLAALPADLLAETTYTLVERSRAGQERQRSLLRDYSNVTRWVDSVTELQPAPVGCVFANEVIDNLPIHLAEVRDGELKELCVTLENDRFAFIALPPSSPHIPSFLARVGIDPRDGYRYEIPLASESFVARCSSIVDIGGLILVDYGLPSLELARRPTGTLLCYSSSGVDDDPLTDVGSKDITAHVNWSALTLAIAAAGMDAIGPIQQRDVLVRLGLRELDATLRAEHDAALSAGQGAAALAAISTRQALGALSDPGGLGSLEVLVGTRGIGTPAFASDRYG